MQSEDNKTDINWWKEPVQKMVSLRMLQMSS